MEEIYGEYYRPDEHNRSPGEVRDLRAENRRQNARLKRIEEHVDDLREGQTILKVTLIGPDGENGLRGELRRYQGETNATLKAITDKLDSMPMTIAKIIFWTVGAMGTVGGLIIGLLRLLGG
jgi:hypothetical protein